MNDCGVEVETNKRRVLFLASFENRFLTLADSFMNYEIIFIASSLNTQIFALYHESLKNWKKQ
jgi:hypothetical protein